VDASAGVDVGVRLVQIEADHDLIERRPAGCAMAAVPSCARTIVAVVPTTFVTETISALAVPRSRQAKYGNWVGQPAKEPETATVTVAPDVIDPERVSAGGVGIVAASHSVLRTSE
jgi:hypothetical protein